ncbi:MAG: host specificity protein J, partial [bacterium]
MPQVIPAIVAFAGTTVGAFALQLGGSLLLSAVASKLARKDVAKATMQGRTVSVRSPAASRRIVYGRARAGGTIVYIESRAGADREDGTLDLVIVLSGRPVRQIGAVYFDGEMAADAAGVSLGRFAGFLSVQKQYGYEVDSPFSVLRAVSGGKWTAAHRMQGCAAVHISLTFSPDVYPSGIPNISVDMEGRNDIFDPRTGTTGYSENPALCLANYMA